jgi:hypothetical protein
MSQTRIGPLPALLAGALLCSSCAASLKVAAREAPALQLAPAPPAPLDRSLFLKPPERENLSEEVIARVIDAPIEPQFPARAGVVLLDAPFQRRAHPALQPGDEAPQALARAIERSRHFVMVTDISPYLADGQHVESLRELAARYRLKYLVVLNARYADRSAVNGWGWGWLSLVGIPFLPAYTLETAGVVEATLMDVRTGTFLFTIQIHTEARQRTTPWRSAAKIGAMQRAASRKAAELLAERFLGKCNRLVAEVQRQRRVARTQATAAR